jgi:hypothetical protein
VPDEGYAEENWVKGLSLLETGLQRDTLKDPTNPTMVRECQQQGVPLST